MISDLAIQITEQSGFKLSWMNYTKFDCWPNTQKVIWKVLCAQSQTRKKLNLKSGIFCWTNISEGLILFLYEICQRLEYYSASQTSLLNVLLHSWYFWTGYDLRWIFPPAQEGHYKSPQSNCNAWLSNPSKPINPHITGKLSRWLATNREPP